MDAISAAVPDLQRESAAALNQPFYCHLGGGGDGPLYVKLTPFFYEKISFRLFFLMEGGLHRLFFNFYS